MMGRCMRISRILQIKNKRKPLKNKDAFALRFLFIFNQKKTRDFLVQKPFRISLFGWTGTDFLEIQHQFWLSYNQKNVDFSIGGIKFLEKPYFENPLRIKERKKKAKMVKKIKEKEVKLPEFVFDKKKYYETAKKQNLRQD